MLDMLPRNDDSSCPAWSSMKSRLRQSGVGGIELVEAWRVPDRGADRAHQREREADDHEDDDREPRRERRAEEAGREWSERHREQGDVPGDAADAADEVVRRHRGAVADDHGIEPGG